MVNYVPWKWKNLERVKKSGDNYSLSADFLANSSHIMAGVSTVWLEF